MIDPPSIGVGAGFTRAIARAGTARVDAERALDGAAPIVSVEEQHRTLPSDDRDTLGVGRDVEIDTDSDAPLDGGPWRTVGAL